MKLINRWASSFVLSAGLVLSMDVPLVQAATSTPYKLENSYISEASGICRSNQTSGVYWVHNDSGSTATIYAINGNGDDLATFSIGGLRTNDFEDIGSAVVNGKKMIVAGDVGDNALRRDKLSMLIFEEPAVNPASRHVRGAVDRSKITYVEFTYPDGRRNCEAMAVAPNGEILLCAKMEGASGNIPCNIYSLKTSLYGSSYAGHRRSISAIANLSLNTITAMDISSDGLRCMLLAGYHKKGYEYTRTSSETWAQAFAKAPRIITMPQGNQIEAGCYNIGADKFMVTSELGGANVPVAVTSRTIPLWVVTLRSGPVVEPIPDTMAPSIPYNARAAANSSSAITVSWDRSSDNVGVAAYDVYAGSTKVGSTSLLTLTVNGLAANTSFSFTVRARDTAGNASANSNVASAKTLADTTPPPPPTTGGSVYEAEKAVVFGGVSHGTYVDFINSSGDYIEWTVNAPSSGRHTLEFKYALSTGNRPLQLKVNGNVIAASLSFPATGSNSVYKTITTEVPLTKGTNKIRVTAIGASGANMDALTVTYKSAQ